LKKYASVIEYKTVIFSQTPELTSFDFTRFEENLNLSEPMAVNYFIQKEDPLY